MIVLKICKIPIFGETISKKFAKKKSHRFIKSSLKRKKKTEPVLVIQQTRKVQIFILFVGNFQKQLPENLLYVTRARTRVDLACCNVYTVLANYKVERVGLFLD